MTYERYQNGVPGNNGSSSSREIQTDVIEIREEMAKTLDEISAKLVPKELISHLIGSLGDGGLTMFKGLSGAVARNPIPAAMIAGGIGYLIYEEVQSRESRTTGAAAPVGEPVTARAGELVGRVREGAHGLAHRASSVASNVATQAKQTTRQVAHKGQDLVREQPLVLAGLGFALGAALAGTAPLSRREQQLLGEPAGELMGELEQRAHQIKDRVEKGVRAAGEVAKQALTAPSDQQRPEGGGQGRDASAAPGEDWQREQT